jgi:2-dehydro-3-deoxyphosphogluconate aldolase/(4S)-4-hydroxy-2-oxoglutarate aldolase
MARFDRLTVLNAVAETGLVPVFYNGDLEVAKQIVTACAGGGAKVVEFTNRGDQAWNVFTQLVKWAEKAQPDTILGVGSVIDAPTAALYISSGANFVVGPVLNPEVARLCNRRKIAYMPGCGSASEISEAEELGAEIVKVFPGTQVGGPGFVKAVLGPMPWTRIMPTGGVEASEKSIRSWFMSGAACVGIGSKLITKELVAAQDYDAISVKVAQVLAWIRNTRIERAQWGRHGALESANSKMRPGG